MFRITRTIFYKRNGEIEHSQEEVEVEDLEEYRKSLMQSKYSRINFVYQEEDNDSREDKAD